MHIFFSIIITSLFFSSCVDFFGAYQNEGEASIYLVPFPSRPAGARTGSQFMKYTSSMSAEDREKAIFDEIASGNVPQFCRKSVPVRFTATVSGKLQRATIFVLPDYLAIGSDQDYIRIPMTPITAQKIADRFGYSLPTRKMVNEIYRQASIKMSPSPQPPSPRMVTNEYYERHERMIKDKQPKNSAGKLIAGHKKDVVITNRLLSMPRRVAIYGWHRKNGLPIQPLSLVHHDQYADYSHGVRLVQNVMQVGNFKMLVGDVLKDRRYSVLLSDEGPMSRPRATPSGRNPSVASR